MTSAQQAYAMLGNETLWDAARQCHDVLRAAVIPHAVAGGVAVCLHGYQRNTVDLDLVVRTDDEDAIRAALESAGSQWSDTNRECRTPGGIAILFLLSGDRAGKGAQVRISDPANESTIVELEGLPAVSLERLIELKIACGEGNPRRTHKDFADVVELIVVHGLDKSFAGRLHKSVRKTFKRLVENAGGA